MRPAEAAPAGKTLCIIAMLAAALVLTNHGSAAAQVDRLRQALASVRFAAYTPRAFLPPDAGPPTAVPAAAMAADLELLRDTFDGLITYSTSGGLELLPALAAKHGYRALILGVWDPRDRGELSRALSLASTHATLVVGLSIGNEGLFSGRYTLPDLLEALLTARRHNPRLALTTSEPFAWLLAPAPELLSRIDFLLPNVHPLTENWFAGAPEEAAWRFVVNVAGLLQRHGKPILIKETGLPSAPASAGLSPQRQARFWQALLRQLPSHPDRAVAAFEAFDAPWKPAEIARQHALVPPGEDSWGFFTAAGAPKPVVEVWRQANPVAPRPGSPGW